MLPIQTLSLNRPRKPQVPDLQQLAPWAKDFVKMLLSRDRTASRSTASFPYITSPVEDHPILSLRTRSPKSFEAEILHVTVQVLIVQSDRKVIGLVSNTAFV